MKPGTFLEATAALNPAAAWREEADIPVAPPVAAAPIAEPDAPPVG